jgi:ABC-type multidrug transport system ATPase subunit
MTRYEVRAKNICKRFSKNKVFEDLNFCFSGSGLYGISGGNGTGKSTLCRLIAGILAPSSGEIEFSYEGEILYEEKAKSLSGFTAPYIELYGEFSAYENIKYLSGIRGQAFEPEYMMKLMRLFGIYNSRDEAVKKYSTGMKHKLVLITALVFNPSFLILDEPYSNLDQEGCKALIEIINEYAKKSIVIIASNRPEELADCRQTIQLEG